MGMAREGEVVGGPPYSLLGRVVAQVLGIRGKKQAPTGRRLVLYASNTPGESLPPEDPSSATPCSPTLRPAVLSSADKEDFVEMINVEKLEYDFDSASADDLCAALTGAVRPHEPSSFLLRSLSGLMDPSVSPTPSLDGLWMASALIRSMRMPQPVLPSSCIALTSPTSPAVFRAPTALVFDVTLVACICFRSHSHLAHILFGCSHLHSAGGWR